MPWLSTPANRGRQKSLAAETLAIIDENGFGDKSIGVVGIENMPHPVHELLGQDLGWKFTVPRDIVAELRYAKTREAQNAGLKVMRGRARRWATSPVQCVRKPPKVVGDSGRSHRPRHGTGLQRKPLSEREQ